ncbi:MAG: hypothetical protein KDA45_04455 [Planctomycetales bacterium]|nr:hypothetical protein [Planctomycetales bacterium]
MNIVVLRRRLFYICAMVVLLVPLYFLGNPSVRNSDGSVNQPGGTLAQIRTAYDLGQGDLGEIDPASESMRLATLGLRGVAATILWQKAEYYKKEQFWDRLSATLNQIAVLQPHFVEVWKFQSHNLSYNVSAEFDDYRQRYQWVKRGIDYLIKGSKYNKRRTEMPFELGGFFGSKMGVADEKTQFRALYRDDENFHKEVFDRTSLDLTQSDGLGPDRKPDNWLSGRLWYLRSYDMVEAGSQPAKSTMMFYLKGPQWLMKYAEAMQAEGTLDEPARYAWRTAGRDWKQFGERPILTTFGETIYLTELKRAVAEYKKAAEEFEEYAGDTFQKIQAERKAMLSAEELRAWEKQPIERDFDEMIAAEKAGSVLSYDALEVAKELPEEKRVEAMQMAKNLEVAADRIKHIEIYRNQINYAYWEGRCVAEQDDDAILARTSMYDANRLLDKGELDAALEKYDVAWEAWASLFNKYPAMMIDDAADDVLDSVERYRRLLDQPELPRDFGLAGFLTFRTIHESGNADPALMQVISSWPEEYPDRDFVEEMLRKAPMDEQMREAGSQPAEGIDVAPPEPGQPPAPRPAKSAPAEVEDSDGSEPAASASSPSAADESDVSEPAAGSPPRPRD